MHIYVPREGRDVGSLRRSGQGKEEGIRGKEVEEGGR